MPLKPHHRPKRRGKESTSQVERPRIVKASTLQQAVNFASAVGKHLASGMKKRDQDEYERALSICRECPSLTDNGRCAECGCFVRIKARWATQSCPLGKW